MDKFRIDQYRKWYGYKSTHRKILIIMKLTFALMLAFGLGVHARALAQKVTLSSKSISLEELFKEIKKQTSYRFMFEEGLLDHSQQISLDLKDASLEAVLQKAFKNQPLSYQIYDGTVIVKKKSVTIESFIQNKIHGVAKDERNRPFAGVSVRVAGKNITAVTDSRGAYEIQASVGDSLRFTFVGYKTKTLAVKGVVLNLSLQLDEGQGLDEVVVIGYQQQSLRKTTSAVQVVSGKQIENLPAPSFETLLQGRVSGINIQNFTGEPGVRNTFTVRGNTTISGGLNDEVDLANTMSSPLFVIDGMPISSTDLSGGATGTNYIAGINVNDIESIVVQKDAAATAVWGSRGANGVIIIKTKQGSTGRPTVRLSYYTGASQRPELQRTYAGAEERRQKMDILNEYGSHAQLGVISQILTDSLNPSYNNATDWQDLFYSTGRISNYDVNISAGNDVLNYRLSLNHYNEDGIMRNTGFKRYSLRGNFDFRLFPIAKTSLIISASRMDRKRGLGRSANEGDPLPVDKGSMPSSFVKLNDVDYEYYYGQYDKLRDNNQTDAISIFSQTDVDLIKGLRYSSQASGQANIDRRDRFMPTEIAPNGISFASANRFEDYTYNLANILNWTHSIQETHNLNLTAMQSFEYKNRKKTELQGFNLPTDDIKVVQGIAQRDLTGKSDLEEAGLLSYLGQFSYDYKGKYIINASWRADASSRFGRNTKWGYFPAFSAAWVASDEHFLKDIDWLELLKFRASYGHSGTLPGKFYAPYNVWDITTATYGGSGMSTPIYYYDPNRNSLTQPNLTWNKSKQTNLGLDLYLFKSRLNITADAYRKETISPIFAFAVPFYTGYTKISYNVPMNILNEGVDLTITSRNLGADSKLQWTTNLNLSYNKNRLASLPNNDRTFYMDSRGYNQQLLFSVGGPIYGWAQMIYQGVYNQQGDIPVNPITGQRLTYFKGNYPVQPGFPNWLDVNNDWDVWSDEDRGNADGDLVQTGDPNPKFVGGLYNEFTWKNFSLGILGTFTFKRDIINTLMSNQFSNIWNYGSINNFGNQRLPDMSEINYWTPSKAEDPNYEANFPSISPYGPNFYQFFPFSTLWNEKGDFFKIKTITIGYRLADKLVDRIGIKGARVYAMFDNIYTFQSANIPDAEAISPQGEYDGGAYPLPRKVTFGVELTL